MDTQVFNVTVTCAPCEKLFFNTGEARGMVPFFPAL